VSALIKRVLDREQDRETRVHAAQLLIDLQLSAVETIRESFADPENEQMMEDHIRAWAIGFTNSLEGMTPDSLRKTIDELEAFVEDQEGE